MDNVGITLTSKIGRFAFVEGTRLSHAQLIRDTIVGQWLNPHDREMELYTVADVQKFMAQHSSAVLREVEFELTLTEQYELASLLYQMGKKTSHFGDAFKDMALTLNQQEKTIIAALKASA